MRQHEHGAPALPSHEKKSATLERGNEFHKKTESLVINATKELEGYNELVNAGWIKATPKAKEEIKKSQERVKKAGGKFGKYLIYTAVPVIMTFFAASKFTERASAMTQGDKDQLELVKQGTPPIAYDDETSPEEAPAKPKTVEVRMPKTAEVTHTEVKPAPEIKTGSVKENADKALHMKGNLKNCSGFTGAYAELMGHSELKGLTANQQIVYMNSHWKIVDAPTAQRLAKEGHLVIAGVPAKDHGHTTAVIGGDGEYPNVEGGAMSRTGAAISHGEKTADMVWPSKDHSRIKYYTPN